ncbi:MAG: tripartite tricarboxylate transporter TctB family protein, partial [Planctomycetaceae bacterium]|nr:tripartite tricarboxylate transporter TctB family protein [Planctomycetaceae bacterium]
KIAWRQVVAVLVCLVLYLLAFHAAGFALSTFLFAAVLQMLLGAKWWSSALAAGAMVILVQLLFINLFRVPLP